MNNTLTYVLSTDALNAGTDGVDIYESGSTNLTLSFSGVNNHPQWSGHYLKFLVKYSDLDEIRKNNIQKILTLFRYF